MSSDTAIARLLHKLAEREEDRICAEKMRQAEEEGYLTPAESAAFIRKMRDAFGIFNPPA